MLRTRHLLPRPPHLRRGGDSGEKVHGRVYALQCGEVPGIDIHKGAGLLHEETGDKEAT